MIRGIHYISTELKTNIDVIPRSCFNNVTDFWKQIIRSKSNNVSLPVQIDGVKGDKDINNLFIEKYNTLLNSVSYDNSDMERLK